LPHLLRLLFAVPVPAQATEQRHHEVVAALAGQRAAECFALHLLRQQDPVAVEPVAEDGIIPQPPVEDAAVDVARLPGGVRVATVLHERLQEALLEFVRTWA